MNSKEVLDQKLYNASLHLVEAAKYMSDVNKDIALRFMLTADKMLSIIDAPEEKMSKEQMVDILNEILNAEA